MLASPSPEDIYIANETFARVVSLVKTLKPREERIIREHYGIGADQRTLETIAAEFDLTRERIRQIELKALRVLRHRICVGARRGDETSRAMFKYQDERSPSKTRAEIANRKHAADVEAARRLMELAELKDPYSKRRRREDVLRLTITEFWQRADSSNTGVWPRQIEHR